VRDGAAKGKIERFFRTVRDQFLSLQLDLSSLEALNRQFTHWVEEHYNAQLHSILGMSPLDRFALDRSRVRFLPPNEANDELFFVEEDRHVCADNTFSFKSKRWEAPRHLPDRTIQIRFQRKSPATRLIVYYKGERMGEARLLNPITNDRKPVSESVNQPVPAQQEVFDILRVHAQQGGLCLVLGEPGTGKSILKHALLTHDPKRMITPVVNRTLHT
jgi:hypothetical protein